VYDKLLKPQQSFWITLYRVGPQLVVCVRQSQYTYATGSTGNASVTNGVYFGRRYGKVSEPMLCFRNKLVSWMCRVRLGGGSSQLRSELPKSMFPFLLTRARHLYLAWVRWINFTPSSPVALKSISIYSTHLRLGLQSGIFPSGFRTKSLYLFSTYVLVRCQSCWYWFHHLPYSYISVSSPAGRIIPVAYTVMRFVC